MISIERFEKKIISNIFLIFLIVLEILFYTFSADASEEKKINENSDNEMNLRVPSSLDENNKSFYFFENSFLGVSKNSFIEKVSPGLLGFHISWKHEEVLQKSSCSDLFARQAIIYAVNNYYRNSLVFDDLLKGPCGTKNDFSKKIKFIKNFYTNSGSTNQKKLYMLIREIIFLRKQNRLEGGVAEFSSKYRALLSDFSTLFDKKFYKIDQSANNANNQDSMQIIKKIIELSLEESTSVSLRKWHLLVRSKKNSVNFLEQVNLSCNESIALCYLLRTLYFLNIKDWSSAENQMKMILALPFYYQYVSGFIEGAHVSIAQDIQNLFIELLKITREEEKVNLFFDALLVYASDYVDQEELKKHFPLDDFYFSKDRLQKYIRGPWSFLQYSMLAPHVGNRLTTIEFMAYGERSLRYWKQVKPIPDEDQAGDSFWRIFSQKVAQALPLVIYLPVDENLIDSSLLIACDKNISSALIPLKLMFLKSKTFERLKKSKMPLLESLCGGPEEVAQLSRPLIHLKRKYYRQILNSKIQSFQEIGSWKYKARGEQFYNLRIESILLELFLIGDISENDWILWTILNHPLVLSLNP